LTVADKKLTEIADSKRGQIRDRVVASRQPPGVQHAGQQRLQFDLHLERRRWPVRRVTEEFFNATGPAWDPQGNYLYYLSDREFAQISSVEFNYATNRTAGIFAVAPAKT
jgi:tricorn protease